jgi:hypothetical protein
VAFGGDLGVRIARFVFIGGFFQYGVLGTSCLTPSAGVTITCSGHDMRAGVETLFHIVPRGAIDPWIGIGFGHEWLQLNASASAGSANASESLTFDGWNFADLSVGFDFHVADSGVGVGPYFELTSGNFTSLSQSVTGTGLSPTSGSSDISAQSSHQWFTLGVRGTFEVGGEREEQVR